MKIVFADRGWEDFTHWVENDRKIAARIVRLIKEIEREPFDGLGKPEPLRHDLAGFWSRRMTDEHPTRLNADYAFGLELEILNGQLTGAIEGDVLKPDGKAIVLKKILAKENLNPKNCISRSVM